MSAQWKSRWKIERRGETGKRTHKSDAEGSSWPFDANKAKTVEPVWLTSWLLAVKSRRNDGRKKQQPSLQTSSTPSNPRDRLSGSLSYAATRKASKSFDESSVSHRRRQAANDQHAVTQEDESIWRIQKPAVPNQNVFSDAALLSVLYSLQLVFFFFSKLKISHCVASHFH